MADDAASQPRWRRFNFLVASRGGDVLRAGVRHRDTAGRGARPAVSERIKERCRALLAGKAAVDPTPPGASAVVPDGPPPMTPAEILAHDAVLLADAEALGRVNAALGGAGRVYDCKPRDNGAGGRWGFYDPTARRWTAIDDPRGMSAAAIVAHVRATVEAEDRASTTAGLHAARPSCASGIVARVAGAACANRTSTGRR